jgi:hypothetical protein
MATLKPASSSWSCTKRAPFIDPGRRSYRLSVDGGLGGAVVTWTVLPCISSRHTSSRWRDRSNPACNIAIGLLVVSSTVATGRLPPRRPSSWHSSGPRPRLPGGAAGPAALAGNPFGNPVVSRSRPRCHWSDDEPDGASRATPRCRVPRFPASAWPFGGVERPRRGVGVSTCSSHACRAVAEGSGVRGGGIQAMLGLCRPMCPSCTSPAL